MKADLVRRFIHGLENNGLELTVVFTEVDDALKSLVDRVVIYVDHLLVLKVLGMLGVERVNLFVFLFPSVEDTLNIARNFLGKLRILHLHDALRAHNLEYLLGEITAKGVNKLHVSLLRVHLFAIFHVFQLFENLRNGGIDALGVICAQ